MSDCVMTESMGIGPTLFPIFCRRESQPSVTAPSATFHGTEDRLFVFFLSEFFPPPHSPYLEARLPHLPRITVKNSSFGCVALFLSGLILKMQCYAPLILGDSGADSGAMESRI